MDRPVIENDALTVRTSVLTSQQQIELCAPCHSRRMSLDDNIHRHADFLDYGIPQLLSPGMYFADGQIQEEVYVYGSFIQSKIYARDIRCSGCHDVHSGFRIREGNDLCLQCHMPGRDYMGIDYRPDHSFRIPRPDLTQKIGVPNACNRCHADKTVLWSMEKLSI